MPRPMTRAYAYSAGLDAANRSMRAAGRKAWNEVDANIAAREFSRLWPLCQHGADSDCCALCNSENYPLATATEAKSKRI